jgi:hypothetical protein
MKWMKLSLIPWLVFLAACSSNVSPTPVQSAPAVEIVTPSSQDPSPAETIIVTDQLPVEKKEVLGPLPTEIIKVMAVPTVTNTVPFITPTTQKSYEVIAPNKIKAGEFTIAATSELTKTDFNFWIKLEYPASIAKKFPEENVPSPIKEVEYKFKDIQLDLKQAGSGGGGSGGDITKTIVTGFGLLYKIMPALPKGKAVHVTATVTFDDYYGISEPVPFDFDLVAK